MVSAGREPRDLLPPAHDAPLAPGRPPQLGECLPGAAAVEPQRRAAAPGRSDACVIVLGFQDRGRL
jgi:hypothetical protein